MYNFIDVNEASDSTLLPSEALQINGEYIENLIPGYRTLSVSGRESLSPEIETYETGARDGAKVKNRRYPARIIVVKYQLIAASNEAFREAYNRLGGILNVDDAMLVFNDETDKFFIGTPYEMGDVEPGRNAIISEFSILCADPFKYSVQEYTATAGAGENSVLIDYKGTYKAYPVLESDFYKESEVSDDGESATALTGSGDCGFVSFFTEDEKIIQLGNPAEVDTITNLPQSQTLMNQPFNTAGAWGTTSKSLWTENGGYTILTTSQVGTPGMKALKFVVTSPAKTSGTLLQATVDNGSMPVRYTVTASTSGRTANSVKVSVTVSASVDKRLSVGKLYAFVYMGNSWHNLVVPVGEDNGKYYDTPQTGNSRPSLYLEQTKTYSASMTFTVTGLATTTKTLTGIKFKTDARHCSFGDLEESACANLAVSPYETPGAVSYYLTASGYGTATGWHGPVITRSVPEDAAGVTGATDFKLTYAQVFAACSKSEIGAFQMNLTGADNKSIAAVVIYKNKTGTTGSIVFYVNGVKQYGTERDLSQFNEFFGAATKSNKSTAIHKNGDKILFNVGGIQKTFTNSAIAEKAVTKITFAFTQWGTNAALSYNGIYNLKFIKNNCDDMKDVPNKFSANDVLEADCGTGEIYLNGVSSPELGALGNDWEEFYLTPGLNEIGFAYSDWVTSDYAPEIKIRYREAFL